MENEKQKVIEEMANIAHSRCWGRFCLECGFYGKGAKCQTLLMCSKLYEANYRKADDVEREKSKKIIHKINNLIDCDGWVYIIDYEKFKNLAKQYGIEVDYHSMTIGQKKTLLK